jgi:hypothetical protein
VKGRARCRLHGGAEGSGAPEGNRNALKHGRYTAEAIACRRMVAALLRACRDQIGVQERSGSAGAVTPPQTPQTPSDDRRRSFQAQAPLDRDEPPPPEWAR